MASPSPPSRCSPTLDRPTPPGFGCARREGARKTLAAGRPRERSRAAPTRGAVGGCYREVWIDSEKRERDERTRIGGKREAKEQNSLRHGRWGRRWLSSAGQRPGTAPRAGASDFRGGGFCLLCRRRRRSCGCRGS